MEEKEYKELVCLINDTILTTHQEKEIGIGENISKEMVKEYRHNLIMRIENTFRPPCPHCGRKY